MADDIDFKKCAEFYDGHIGIPHDPSACTNLTKICKNHALNAEIADFLANLKNCTRLLMTLTLKNVQNLMTVLSVSHLTHQHVPILPNLAKTVLLMLKLLFYWRISKTVQDS